MRTNSLPSRNPLPYPQHTLRGFDYEASKSKEVQNTKSVAKRQEPIVDDKSSEATSSEIGSPLRFLSP